MPPSSALLASAEAARPRRRRRRQWRSLELPSMFRSPQLPESPEPAETHPISMSPSPPPTRDWAGLPPDLISSIFHRLDAVEIMLCADKVCHSWRRAARKEPELWRRIDMRGRAHLAARGLADLRKMAADALARSQGQCEAFLGEGSGVVDDNFLLFLAHQAPLLKSLIINSCREVTHEGFMKAIERFPLLEELEVSKYPGVYTSTRDALKKIAVVCPRLKHLRLIHTPYIICGCPGCSLDLPDDREALAIATMHELRSLQLVYNDLTNQGLEAILDNCPHLESLDMQKCRHIVMDNTLRVKCARINTMKLLVYDLQAKDEYFRDFESEAIECSTCASYFRQHIGDQSWRGHWTHWSTSMANDKAKMVITTVYELRSLELHRKSLTTDGLRAILEKCPHLEIKDILRCRNIVVKNALGGDKIHWWRIPTKELTTRLVTTGGYYGSYTFNLDTFPPIRIGEIKANNCHRKAERAMAEIYENKFYSKDSDRQKIEPDNGSDIGECSTCLMIEYLSWKVLDPDGHSDYYDPSYDLDSIDEKVLDSDEHSDYYDPFYGLDSIDESVNVYDKVLPKRLRRYLLKI